MVLKDGKEGKLPLSKNHDKSIGKFRNRRDANSEGKSNGSLEIYDTTKMGRKTT
jgi:hypothetical protein